MIQSACSLYHAFLYCGHSRRIAVTAKRSDMLFMQTLVCMMKAQSFSCCLPSRVLKVEIDFALIAAAEWRPVSSRGRSPRLRFQYIIEPRSGDTGGAAGRAAT